MCWEAETTRARTDGAADAASATDFWSLKLDQEDVISGCWEILEPARTQKNRTRDRPAAPQDREAVEATVRAAYSVYIERMGKPPGPMLDNYARLIADHALSVVEEAGEIVALIVLLPKPDHLLLDNVAVRPDRQGAGLGRRLIAFAGDEARRRGYGEVRLYTHQTMTEKSRSIGGSVLSRPAAARRMVTSACS